MNELNTDWVLIASIGSVVVATLVAAIWGWKAFKSMDKTND